MVGGSKDGQTAGVDKECVLIVGCHACRFIILLERTVAVETKNSNELMSFSLVAPVSSPVSARVSAFPFILTVMGVNSPLPGVG